MLLAQSTVIKRPFYLGVTLLAPAVRLSKNGGAFALAAGLVTEISRGWYELSMTVVDTNTIGALAWAVSGAGVPSLIGQPVDQVQPAPFFYGVLTE